MSQSSEQIRYLENQQGLQDARDAANLARKRKPSTTVFVGPSYAMAIKDISAAQKIHNPSPIYETTYDHVRPAKSATESGIVVNAEEVDSWIDSMEAEYGELLDGGFGSEDGFLDAACFSDIAPKGLKMKRKLFGKKTQGMNMEERVAGSGSKDVVTVKRKAEDIESPFRDKRAYRAMRAMIPVRAKDRRRIEADIWLERFPEVPTGLCKIQHSLEQMAISLKDSPPTLSEGSTVTPESDGNENADADEDEDEDDGNKDDSNDLIDLLFSTAEKKAFQGDELGSWVWRSSKHPTKGFEREKVWVLASDWS